MIINFPNGGSKGHSILHNKIQNFKAKKKLVGGQFA